MAHDTRGRVLVVRLVGDCAKRTSQSVEAPPGPIQVKAAREPKERFSETIPPGTQRLSRAGQKNPSVKFTGLVGGRTNL